MTILIEVISYIGMICLLVALVVNRKYHIITDILNVVGAILLVIWSYVFGAWAMLILDIVWGMVATMVLIKDIRKRIGIRRLYKNE